MLSASDRQRILAKLINACHDLEDALSQLSPARSADGTKIAFSVPGARYDPRVIPQALRNELSVVRDDLARIIRRLEESS
jgi:hypothetical protein